MVPALPGTVREDLGQRRPVTRTFLVKACRQGGPMPCRSDRDGASSCRRPGVIKLPPTALKE